jgi:hypothetical protein
LLTQPWHNFFNLCATKQNQLKKYLLSFFMVCSFFAKAQKVEKIYVNLYTDSLKKGTYNYINIDGQLANGKYLPLDSTHLIFWASAGKFNGNSLWIDRDIAVNKIDIKVSMRNNPAIVKEFTIYIKQQPDPELKTIDEIINKSKTKKG